MGCKKCRMDALCVLMFKSVLTLKKHCPCVKQQHSHSSETIVSVKQDCVFPHSTGQKIQSNDADLVHPSAEHVDSKMMIA